MKKINWNFIYKIVTAFLLGFLLGTGVTAHKIMNKINLRAINEDYDNEVILEINGDLYENDENGKFYKYATIKGE